VHICIVQNKKVLRRAGLGKKASKLSSIWQSFYLFMYLLSYLFMFTAVNNYAKAKSNRYTQYTQHYVKAKNTTSF